MPAPSHPPASDPSTPSPLAALRQQAAACTACDLYRHATQTVFGRGSEQARIMLVGEQPGDAEDLAGVPFVGPAGALLDRALKQAGLVRARCYVTNAVKHFKWEPRGKRRLHKTPAQREIQACLHWLRAEIAALQPQVIVCLGATAAKALLGAGFRVTQSRGQWSESPLAPGARVLATVHPSAVLRTEAAQREAAYAALVQDLEQVVAAVG